MTGAPALWCAVAGLACAAVLAAGADFLAPYHPAEQMRDHPLQPPTPVRWIEDDGRVHLWPFVYAQPGNIVRPLRLFVRGYRYRVLGAVALDRHLLGVEPPATLFVMGTDSYGRDQFSRFLQATRVSLTAAFLAASVALLLGGVLGMVAGLYRGWVDEAIMRTGEAFLSLPWMYLVLAVRAFLPLRFPEAASYAVIVLVPGVLAWARMARVVRGAALPLAQAGYAVAARGFGASGLYVMRKHIAPDLASLALTQATIMLPRFIGAEITLSFLGLGIDEPLASWGNMLGGLQQYHTLVSHAWLLLPMVGPVFVSLCCFLLVDEIGAWRARVAG